MPVTWRQTVHASAAASGTSTNWIPLDIFETPFNVGFGVTTSNDNGVTFAVQHTFDNVLDADVSARAFNHSDVTAGVVDVDGNYAFAVRAVRLNVVSVSASANLEFRGVQAGNI